MSDISQAAPTGPEAAEEKFALTTSPHFPEWLARAGASIAFSTYQAGKLFFLGLRPDGRLSVFERTFARCMGLGGQRRRAHARAGHALSDLPLRQRAARRAGQARRQRRALCAASAWITGDLDVHDIGIDAGRRPVFVNTLFSCLATVSDGSQFQAALAAALRFPAGARGPLPSQRPGDARRRAALCHRRRGARTSPTAGATSASTAALSSTSRPARSSCEGLSMPHSPRLHDGRLWLLNSGDRRIRLRRSRERPFEPSPSVPAMRAVSPFVGDHAIIGLSLARENRTFQGLPLDQALAKHGAEARCGLLVIDLKTGDTIALGAHRRRGARTLRRGGASRRAQSLRHRLSRPTRSCG